MIETANNQVQAENEADHQATLETEECPECGLALIYCDNHWAPGTTRRAWIGCPNMAGVEEE